ncbi:hypothetical protein SCB29_12075 [Paraburkholderia sp. SIMBA_055]|jgi:hypothetical protein|uniref:Uncharacterized protein n=1 Tax=Paraburkholderia graminis (strain ATCC 700544 / DSM 17151 / LMG 18924 / NCIMB 13744 / C4D1M) TaxID=396598 RepID=B1GBK1_PARG4|nr:MULTISPECIES: hypothetical protein [Paraburkholderia]AXF08103.1 hypothetical protein CUJ91_09300 [Paraburkholderia graminis]EDT06491.1 hypothetical protein BgramDRAFT_6738 [Paraburkholderia graminis C4D1M]
MVNAGLAWSCQLSRRRAVCRQVALRRLQLDNGKQIKRLTLRAFAPGFNLGGTRAAPAGPEVRGLKFKR